MSVQKEINGIRIPKKELNNYCKKHHIKKMAFFGSILKGDFNPNSDIDILVEFEKEHIPGFFKLMEIEEELSKFFQGVKVDLRTPNDLSRYFRSKVVSNAVVIYAGS